MNEAMGISVLRTLMACSYNAGYVENVLQGGISMTSSAALTSCCRALQSKAVQLPNQTDAVGQEPFEV